MRSSIGGWLALLQMAIACVVGLEARDSLGEPPASPSAAGAVQEGDSAGIVAKDSRPKPSGSGIKKSGKLTVVEAKYGIEGKWKVITDIVRSSVAQERLIISPCDHEFGDPAYGAVKTLVVRYRYGDEPEQTAETTAEPIVIHPSVQVRNKGFRFLGAAYGVGTKWIDITEPLQRFAQPKGLKVVDYQDGVSIAGQDPRFGARKYIVLLFLSEGREQYRVFADGAPLRVP